MIEPEQLCDEVTLYEGDCLEVLELLGSGCADLVFTSPPYNLGSSPWPHLGHWKPGDSAGGKSKWRNGSDAGAGIQYNSHADSIPWGEYVAWQQSVLSALWRAVEPGGAVFYNHKPRVIGARLWKPDELFPSGLILRQEVIWDRGGGLNYNSTAFVPQHERVYVFAHERWRLRDRAASGAGDVWRFPPDRGNSHPAPFPVTLVRHAIKPTTAEIILDPFAGSGTTAVAAIAEGRKCILIEKDPAYCNIIRRRVREAAGIGSLFATS